MHIITVGKTEVHLVAPLFNDYRIFYRQDSDIDLAKQFISERVAKGESVIFLAQDEAGLGIGFTQLYPSFSSVSAKPIWILNDLYVSTGERGKGVGKALLNQAKTFAIANNAKGLALATAHDNVGAQGLYESLDYVRDSAFYHYFLHLEQ